MLPEQAFREFLDDQQRRGYLATSAIRFWLLLFLSYTKRQGAVMMPETLTGDEWRAAWADAHDAETQEAMDNLY